MPTYSFDELDLREEPNRSSAAPSGGACAESTIVSQSCTKSARCSDPCCD